MAQISQTKSLDELSKKARGRCLGDSLQKTRYASYAESEQTCFTILNTLFRKAFEEICDQKETKFKLFLWLPGWGYGILSFKTSHVYLFNSLSRNGVPFFKGSLWTFSQETITLRKRAYCRNTRVFPKLQSWHFCQLHLSFYFHC